MKITHVLTVFVLVLCCARPAVSQVKGSGTTNYVPIWTNSSTIGNSKIYQTGGQVGIGTTSPQWSLDVNGRINVADGYGYRIGGDSFLHAPGDVVSQNTAVGDQAMNSTTGTNNTAVGYRALWFNTFGYGNIAIGASAGQNQSPTSTYNIYLGHYGAAGDDHTIRIGQQQTSFFAVGIRGVTTGHSDAIPVLIDSSGQLGTVDSSRRFKEDIQDMGTTTEGLMRLRPVTFRYQKPYADGSKPIQYGLIAEEVAEVYPELVAHSADGQIESVKYQMLDPMLLNQVQRQQAEIQELKEKLAKLEAALLSMSQDPRFAPRETSRTKR